MASKLGAAFLRCSLGPLNYAGGCIISGKVADGLRELSVDNLHGGFKRGVEEAARQVAVPVPDVERLLPMADVTAVAARLDLAQKNAVAAWAQYAGQIGGLLKGVADLTVDGRAPDVSMFLERLSKKVIRDRELAEPLQALATEVASWLDLVEQCGDLLADGGVLAQAYQRRRLRQAAVGGTAIALVVASLSVGLWIRSVRARVDVGLAGADPCAAASIDPADLKQASSAQMQQVTERKAACDEQKRREATAREEQERREAADREAQRVRKLREDRCEALAAHLGKGDLQPDDGNVVGEQGALLARVGKGALTKADMTTASLPCADTPAGAKIADAFAAAVLASSQAWCAADEFSDPVRAVLEKHMNELPSIPKQVLARRADDTAKKALIQGGAELTTRAAGLCRLKDALGVRGGKHCFSVASMAGKP
jgi:hypothetical protein